MAVHGQRRDPIKLLWRRLITLGLCIVAVLTMWAVFGVYWKDRESRNLRSLAELQLKDLSDRQAALAASIKALDTARGKEQALRGAYQVGREGEGLVVIVDETPAPNTPATTSPKQWLQKLFW